MNRFPDVRFCLCVGSFFVGERRLLTEKALLFVFKQINAAPLKLADTYKGQETPQRSVSRCVFPLRSAVNLHRCVELHCHRHSFPHNCTILHPPACLRARFSIGGERVSPPLSPGSVYAAVEKMFFFFRGAKIVGNFSAEGVQRRAARLYFVPPLISFELQTRWATNLQRAHRLTP